VWWKRGERSNRLVRADPSGWRLGADGSREFFQRPARGRHWWGMTRRIAPFVASVAFAGCYASHRVPTPSPCDDPEFEADTGLDLAFDAQGVLIGEAFRDERFQTIPGWAPSISDDGRWLVTAYFRDGHDGNLTGVLSDLASGGAREWALHSNLSVPPSRGMARR
jgi:hypothetical protein